jgi:hypothetical protein
VTSQATRVACVRPRSLIVITRCAWKAICAPPDWLTSLTSLREGLTQPQEKHLTRDPGGVAVKAPADVAVSGWVVEAVSLAYWTQKWAQSLHLQVMPSDEGGTVAVNWTRLLEHLGQDFAWVALTGSCLISSIISDPLFLFSSGPRRPFERSPCAVRR